MQNDHSSPFVSVAVEDLDRVHGGTDGFFGGLYKGIVFDIAAGKGGPMLADKMYGDGSNAYERARAATAFKQYLVAGNKLPNGAPHLFGVQ